MIKPNVLLFACVLLVVTACVRKVNWTEDVLLEDGRVVTLKRHQEFGGPHEIGQPPTESDYWFEFKHPDTGELVRWASHRGLDPIALLMDRGIPRLIAVARFDWFTRINCPSPDYLLFEYREHRWVEKAIEELRGRKVKRNIIGSPTEAPELAKNGAHLTSAEAMRSASGYTGGRRIDFGKLTTQTFGMQGCGLPPDWLAEDMEGR